MIQRNSVYYSCARNPENRFDRWRTGSTVFLDDPIPRSDFHAHAVVRARYACILSSTMPAIRYSRNEILCLFCAMKKKEEGRRERERELYLLISSLPEARLMIGFSLRSYCFSFVSFFCFLFISLFSFFSFFFLFMGWNRKSTKGVDFTSNSTKKFGREINFS